MVKKNFHIIHMENFDKKLDNLMTQLETLQLGDTIKLPFSKKIELYQKAFPLIEEANQLLEKLQTEIRNLKPQKIVDSQMNLESMRDLLLSGKLNFRELIILAQQLINLKSAMN